jgi:hypothetical protein
MWNFSFSGTSQMACGSRPNSGKRKKKKNLNKGINCSLPLAGPRSQALAAAGWPATISVFAEHSGIKRKKKKKKVWFWNLKKHWKFTFYNNIIMQIVFKLQKYLRQL